MLHNTWKQNLKVFKCSDNQNYRMCSKNTTKSNIRHVLNLFQMPKRKEDMTKRDVYCTGPLLKAVQMGHIFGKSKTFVDKKMKFSLPDVLSNFHNLKKNYGGRSPAHEALRIFAEENFEEANELELWLPPDWRPNPEVLSYITDKRLAPWAAELNQIWKALGRRMSEDVKLTPELFSSIPLPHSFVVPATKFKEIPYWDTFFIINGLLVCDMTITAKDMIKNLFYLIEEFGYVPHSSRIYYEGRSHPPVLLMILDLYYNYTFDFDFIHENIETIEKEILFWRKNRTVIINQNGLEYELFYYKVFSKGPRPEAYRTYIVLCREDMASGTLANNKKELEYHFTCIKAASESGWGFSSRWFVVHGFNHGSRSNTKTPIIIPVDLNAIMHLNFSLLSKWYKKMGNRRKTREYWVKAEELLSGINTVLWNEEVQMWKDYDFHSNKMRNYFYLSNFMPLYTKSYKQGPNEMTNIILSYLNKYNLDQYEGGLPASTEYSGELWDFPNALPPIQYFLIKGLDKIGTTVASNVAFHFADKFINSCYKGYNEHGTMFASYDCLIPGKFGIGLDDLEYGNETGEGYGWTNGVIFDFFKRWGKDLSVVDDGKKKIK